MKIRRRRTKNPKKEPVLYDVEEVIGRRGTGKRLEYYVKWKGYSDKYNSWEPPKNLIRCPWFIEDYEKKRNAAILPTLPLPEGSTSPCFIEEYEKFLEEYERKRNAATLPTSPLPEGSTSPMLPSSLPAAEVEGSVASFSNDLPSSSVSKPLYPFSSFSAETSLASLSSSPLLLLAEAVDLASQPSSMPKPVPSECTMIFNPYSKSTGSMVPVPTAEEIPSSSTVEIPSSSSTLTSTSEDKEEEDEEEEEEVLESEEEEIILKKFEELQKLLKVIRRKKKDEKKKKKKKNNEKNM